MSYTKTVWEDLPSTNTPLNATNLNNIEDGIEDIDGRIDGIDDKLNGTDIAGDMVVESIKTKNMFDTINVFNGFINTSNTALTYETDGKRYSGYVKIEPNTTYTISKGQGYSFRIATTTNYPADSVSYNTTEANHTATSMTITTGANDNYLVFFFYAEQNGDTGGYMSMANTVQVEVGDTVTEYSPHQNLKPSAEDMSRYSTGEIKIGTWIDGKPLYRKVFNISSISSSNSNLVSTSSLNIRDVVKLYGMLNTSTNQHFPMPLTDSSSNYSVIFAGVDVIRGRAVIGSGSFSSCWIAIEYTKTTD